MGWAVGYDDNWQRDVGYGVPAWCDHSDCNERIDRGLSHVCGDAPYGGEDGCGLYFCGQHLGAGQLCERCQTNGDIFIAKPDHPDWIRHKQTDPSWADWRAGAEQIIRTVPQDEDDTADQRSKAVVDHWLRSGGK